MVSTELAYGMPSGPEFLVVLLILVLLFGARRLPELARAVGRSLTEFKRGREEGLTEGDGNGTIPDSAEKKDEAKS